MMKHGFGWGTSFLFFASSALASIDQAPPVFPYRGGETVFVDFQRASYRIVYDFSSKVVTVESEIEFEAPTAGYPLFDLISDPRNVRLDDRESGVSQIADPDGASKFRVLDTVVAPGNHRLTLTHAFEENVEFRSTGVASAFWMSDLTDRKYLEQYLPTNFEYDAYPMSMRVEVANADGMPHDLRANGNVKDISKNVFEIEFPEFYTASSVYFHLSPKGSIRSTHFKFSSIDGRSLPVEVYSKSDRGRYVREVKKVLAELEKDYGAFPHSKVIVYGAGMGGMEYSGATISSLGAVGHELFHSYNARAVMPAQGNAGWIDEAISSFRDDEYETRSRPGSTTMMAGHSVWTRMTDDDAYSKGAAFLAWMAGRMAANGKNMKVFLRGYFHANYFRTVTTSQFKTAMETYSGFDLTADFDRYIYGKLGKDDAPHGSTWGRGSIAACRREKLAERPPVENPFHPRLTGEQLRDLL